MKSLKSKFKWFSYSSSKWVVKDQRQLAISTMHLAQELLVNVQSLIAQLVKNLPAIQEVWVWFLGWEDPLEKEMATHSSIRAWRIPRTEEPGGLQSMGSQWVGHDLATKPPPPQRWFKKLCKEDESLEEHGAWPSKVTSWEDHQNWSFYNIGEVAEELCVNHSTVIWCLKQIGKVEKLSKGVHHGLIKNHKKLSFWSIIFSYYMQQQIISLSDYDIWWKVDFIQQPAMTSSVVGLGRSSKHFPKPNCAQKRSWSLFGGLLPVWPTTAFWILMKLLQLLSMLSELMRYTKNCKASSDGR